jgi:NAD(P)-dependent dehydrogenase (short-subunit alcohol dehydrogenase family)
MNFEGKVVVVTGGATGIGYATTKVFAKHGARVIIAQRAAQRGLEATERLKPGAVSSVKLDIRDGSAVIRCIGAVIERFGGIDILINNASVTGASALGSFIDSSSELIDRVVDTNLKGTIYCSQVVARHMIETKRRGSIVHVSSVGAYAAQENASVYCATKAAQVMLTQAMAIELAPHGIRVNCVAPGDIQTETSADAVGELKKAGASGRFVRFTPMDRRGGGEEVGQAIAFLASENATFVTGITLVVDGGFLAY